MQPVSGFLLTSLYGTGTATGCQLACKVESSDRVRPWLLLPSRNPITPNGFSNFYILLDFHKRLDEVSPQICISKQTIPLSSRTSLSAAHRTMSCSCPACPPHPGHHGLKDPLFPPPASLWPTLSLPLKAQLPPLTQRH